MKGVVIYATGESHKEYVDEGYPVWGCNHSYKLARIEGVQLDRVFFFDDLDEFERGHQFDTNLKLSKVREDKKTITKQFEKLRKSGVEIVSKGPVEGIERVTVYPLEDIKRELDGRYFTNTVCYMLAMAAYEGYERINLFGVDMKTRHEYLLEKGGVEHWVGFARGCGIEVNISEGSSICPEFYYGYDTVKPWKIIDKEIKDKEKLNG